MIIPPFAGVTLVEYRDRIRLTPYYWYREFVGLGRFKANEVGPQPGEDMHPFFHGIMGNNEIWVVATWHRYEDGREEPIDLAYLDPEATKEEAEKCVDRRVEFLNLTKKELEDLASCLELKQEDRDYIDERFADIKRRPSNPQSIDESDLYEARLKVLGGVQPKTVALLRAADLAENPPQRESLEREAVQAYFAEMALYWTEAMVMEWQRANPIGTEWLLEFARVLRQPARKLDTINHELVLNWLRQKYNLMSADELAGAIRQATGKHLSGGTVKKRRERLGLTTKRPPGPAPKEG